MKSPFSLAVQARPKTLTQSRSKRFSTSAGEGVCDYRFQHGRRSGRG